MQNALTGMIWDVKWNEVRNTSKISHHCGTAGKNHQFWVNPYVLLCCIILCWDGRQGWCMGSLVNSFAQVGRRWVSSDWANREDLEVVAMLSSGSNTAANSGKQLCSCEFWTSKKWEIKVTFDLIGLSFYCKVPQLIIYCNCRLEKDGNWGEMEQHSLWEGPVILKAVS